LNREIILFFFPDQKLLQAVLSCHGIYSSYIWIAISNPAGGTDVMSVFFSAILYSALCYLAMGRTSIHGVLWNFS